MAAIKIVCANCGRTAEKRAIDVKRAKGKLYCGKKCAGKGHRKHKTEAQRKAEKREYDACRRILLRDRLKAEKAAYFKRTYDPVRAAVERKKRMPKHIEYCRRPEYRAWKSEYDKKYRAKKQFGPFAEAALLTIDLNKAIKERMTNAEIKWENKTSNKVQFRRRDDQAPARGRPRQRCRRDRDPGLHG